jgi:hypothetical protein
MCQELARACEWGHLARIEMASPIAQAAIASKKPSNRCESHLGDVSRLSVSALFGSGNPGAVVGVNGTIGWADPCWRLGCVMGDELIAEFCLTPASPDRRNRPFRTLHFARITRLLCKPGSLRLNQHRHFTLGFARLRIGVVQKGGIHWCWRPGCLQGATSDPKNKPPYGGSGFFSAETLNGPSTLRSKNRGWRASRSSHFM